MGIFDDVARFAGHVARGDLNSAVNDVRTGIQDVTGGALQPRGPGAAVGPFGATVFGRPPGELVAAPPASSERCPGGGANAVNPPVQSPAPSPCCDRYRFSDGFLVDGVTGTVWRFDERSKSFEEIAVNHNKAKQTLVGSLIETRLSALRNQYEMEVLGTVAPPQRASQLAAFEKTHLAPLREAANALLY